MLMLDSLRVALGHVDFVKVALRRKKFGEPYCILYIYIYSLQIWSFVIDTYIIMIFHDFAVFTKSLKPLLQDLMKHLNAPRPKYSVADGI